MKCLQNQGMINLVSANRFTHFEDRSRAESQTTPLHLFFEAAGPGARDAGETSGQSKIGPSKVQRNGGDRNTNDNDSSNNNSNNIQHGQLLYFTTTTTTTTQQWERKYSDDSDLDKCWMGNSRFLLFLWRQGTD